MPDSQEPLVERIKRALRDLYSKPLEQRAAEAFPGGEERARPLMDRLELVRGYITTRVDEPVAKRLHGGGRLGKAIAAAYHIPEPAREDGEIGKDE